MKKRTRRKGSNQNLWKLSRHLIAIEKDASIFFTAAEFVRMSQADSFARAAWTDDEAQEALVLAHMAKPAIVVIILLTAHTLDR